jgi:phospholipase C
MDGFLQRPTAPPNLQGVTRAAANTFPIGYYTNLNPDGTPKAVPDLPVIGALAQNYTVLDHYFCSFAGETFPNRFYQHAARTDRDHNTTTISKAAGDLGPALTYPQQQGDPHRRVRRRLAR